MGKGAMRPVKMVHLATLGVILNCLVVGTLAQTAAPNRTRLYAVHPSKPLVSSTVQPYQFHDTTHHDGSEQRHPCHRECVAGVPPMTCRFTFQLEYYHSMSKACYNCPLNRTDCDRPHCIMADGFSRSLIVVNRQMPGPSVEVCQHDIVSIDLINHLTDASSSVHWHGHHQRGTPYMDGVPYVTQCPIPPKSSFRYRYIAATAGTHFWHSHTGCQRADGMYGSMIVRVPRSLDPHRDLYDLDLREHTVQLIDWGHEMGIEKFLEHHHAAGDNKPLTLLVNGRGRWHDAGEEVPAHAFVTKFTVKEGFRYRFRLINAGILNCPIQVSVDNHTLVVISSDGSDIEPVEAESLVTYAGERFDFIIKADQDIGNYWMRFRGLMDCDERFRSAHQVAVLHYEGADKGAPEGEVTYDAGRRVGLTVNALNAGIDADDSLVMPELNATVDDDISLKEKPDIVHYISYDFYPLDNSVFHKSPLYGFYQVPHKKERLYTPQFNHITMEMPSAPPLSQPEDLDPASVCNSSTVGNCTGRFCECVHLLQIPLHAVVELVLIDKGVTFDANHPFHLHGNAFRVVAMDRLGASTSVEYVQELDRKGLITRKLHKAPFKDTVTVPDGGYTIIRFLANNPGVWLFHCHIEFHAEVGMALALKVGEPTDWPPVPHGFPKCGNYLPPEDDSDFEVEVVQLSNPVVKGALETLLPSPKVYMPSIFISNSGMNTPASVSTLFTLVWCIVLLLLC